MNKRRERPPLSDRGRRRALRTWGFYLLALTAWVTVVLAAVFLGYLVCSAFTWYAWDPLYQFLNWVRDYGGELDLSEVEKEIKFSCVLGK